MKKRILASTMASVMALSAAGTMLVSSAAVADYKTEAVTKAELKNFLADKEIVDLAENGGVDNYGSISGENFMTAYQYALSVIDDSDATAADCTAAFQMIKAAMAQLHQYDAKQLLALVEDCRSTYNTENLLNPNSDSDDAIYTDDTWADFAGAFEDAESYTNYTGDIRITTDAYEELADKRSKLKKLTIKTKREIDAARQAYEKALDLEFKYQPWQRGTVKNASSDYNRDVSWGAIYAHIASGEASVKARYDEFAAIKGLTRTSNPNIVAAVDAMELGAKVLNGFTPAAMESGNQRKVTTLISQYQGRLVYTYNSDLAEEVFDSFVSVATHTPEVKKGNVWEDAIAASNKADKWDYEQSENTQYKALNVNSGAKVRKILSAEMTVRSAETNIWYVVDTSVTLLNGKNPIKEISGGVYFTTTEPVAGANEKVFNVKKTREIVISDLIPAGAAEILAQAAAGDSTVSTKETALNDAKDALAAGQASVASAIADIYHAASGTGSTAIAEGGSLKDDLAAVEAEIAKLAGMKADATGKYDTTAKIGELETALNALKTGINDAIAEAKKSTFKSDNAKLAAVIATGADSLQQAIADAITAVNSQAGTDSISFTSAVTAPSVTTATTVLASAEGAIDGLKSAVETAQDEYDDALAAAGASVSGVKKNQQNNIYDLAGEMTSSFTKGLCASKYTDAGLTFDVTTAYTSSGNGNTGNASDETAVSLYDALVLIDKFNADVSTPRVGEWVDIAALDNINEIVAPDSSKAPSNPAWKLLYNYLKYALADEFDATATATYTKSQVETLLSSSYKLVSDTIETSMFATSNDELVEARTLAAEWVKIANNNRRTYKDNVSKYTLADGGEYDSTGIYNKLNDAYKQLKAEYEGFAYSYGDIVNKMSNAAKLIDGGTLSASASASINKALADTALAMTKVEVLVTTGDEEFEESAPFNDDGSLNIYNRVMTVDNVEVMIPGDTKIKMADAKDEGDENHTHWVLKTAVEALDKAVEDATKQPEDQVVNDVDGNGKFEIDDLTAMLNIYASGKAEVAKHDFNKDGKVDLTDLTKLLSNYANRA